MQESIYLDYMATTPVDPAVVNAMSACLGADGCFGNPASASHGFGYAAAKKIAHAKEQIAALIKCSPDDLVFTSGATEANNLAIKGLCEFYHRKGRHIITMATEHKSVLESCDYMQQQGFEVTYLQPQTNGLLDLEQLRDAIRDDTVLITIMAVNNETGIIQDIDAIGRIAREQGVIFHTDATQSVGKVSINLSKLAVDLMSFSAHKLYGPKGIGCLYVRGKPKLRLNAQIHGGGHQRGMRSGTLATHQIVGMGMACDIALSRFDQDAAANKLLHDKLWSALSKIDHISLNGSIDHKLTTALNICVHGIVSQTLMLRTPQLAFSAGSACNAASLKPSHVLSAMQLIDADANSSIRISIGRFTTDHDITAAIACLTKEINYLRSVSPLNI